MSQSVSPDKIFETLSAISDKTGIDIYGLSGGYEDNVGFGSGSFTTIKKPKVGLIVGSGVRAYDAGEIWHLMDTRYKIPTTKIDVLQLSNIDLQKYTHIVLPSYSGSLLNMNKDKIDRWIKGGGSLIAYRSAIKWINKNKLATVDLKSFKREAKGVGFGQKADYNGAQNIGGAIFNTRIDRSHPINFGIEDNTLALFRNSRIFMDPEKNSYDNPIQYTQNPLLSGYISEEQIELLKGSVPFKLKPSGRGSILLMTDNTNFRAFWLGTQQLYANMIFYADFM